MTFWAEHGSATAERSSIDAIIRMFVYPPAGARIIADLRDKFRVSKKLFFSGEARPN
jgi:hypothetical protein